MTTSITTTRLLLPGNHTTTLRLPNNSSFPELELTARPNFMASSHFHTPHPHSSPSPPPPPTTTILNTPEQDNGLFLGGLNATRVQTVLDCGVIPTLSLLGVAGNCLCLVVFLKQRYHSVAKPLLLALCVSDVLFLLASLLLSLPCLVKTVDRQGGRELELALTPQVGVFRDVMGRVTVMMTLAIGVERCVAVTRPLKLRALCTAPRTTSAVLAVFLCVFALLSPAFFKYDVCTHPNNNNNNNNDVINNGDGGGHDVKNNAFIDGGRDHPKNPNVISGDDTTNVNVTTTIATPTTTPTTVHTRWSELHETSFYRQNRLSLDFYLNYFLLVMLRALPFLASCVCLAIVFVSLRRRLQCACPKSPNAAFGAFARAAGLDQRREAETEHGDLVLEERKLTKVLLAVLMLCVVCQLPELLTHLYHVAVLTPRPGAGGGEDGGSGGGGGGALDQPSSDALYVFALDISRLLAVFNSAVKFAVFMWLYKHFYVTFRSLTCCSKK